MDRDLVFKPQKDDWEKHQDWEKSREIYEANFEELERIDKLAISRNQIVGRYIYESVADGRAYYQIVRENKNTVRIRHIKGISGDDYVVHYWGYEATIPKEYALKCLQFRDFWMGLADKKKRK